MKFDNKEFFKLSFYYTLVVALPPLLNLVIRPLIEGPDKLHASDFSQIEITETIIALAFIFTTFAMKVAISRFYYDYIDSRDKYNKLVSSVFNSILARGILLLVAAYILRDYIGRLFTQEALQDFGSYGYAAILVGVSRSINMTAFALYRNEKKVRLFLSLGFAVGVLRSGFQLVGVYYYDMSFIGYVYGTAIGNGIITLVILGYTYYNSGFHYDRKILRPVNKFAFPLFEYAFFAWGINFADRYFLESSPVALGIYSQALILGRGIDIIMQGIQGASQPEFFSMMKEGIHKNIEGIRRVSNLMMAQNQVLIGLAIIPAMLYCMLFKTELQYAAGFIAIVFIRYVARMQYTIFSMPVYYEKKTKVFLYLNIIGLVINLALLYFLVPLYAAYGAVVAILISQTILALGVYFYQKKIVSIPWNLNKLMIYPMGIVLLTAMLEIIKLWLNLNPYFTASLVVIAIFGSLFILYKNELQTTLQKLWKRL